MANLLAKRNGGGGQREMEREGKQDLSSLADHTINLCIFIIYSLRTVLGTVHLYFRDMYMEFAAIDANVTEKH